MKDFIKKTLRHNKYIEMLAYVLQNNQLLNFSGSGEFGDAFDEIYEHNISVAKLYKEKYSGNLQDRILLEIGTGYTRITMLYMIKEYDISRVYCYDRFNCLHPLEEKIINEYNLTKYLDKIKYLSGTNDEINKQIKELSIDYIVSNAVLEHVDNLELLFNNLDSVLKKNGQMYHKVDLRCHNRFKNFGELYFHTFSHRLWKLMGGNIGQPNRKLLKDYYTLFSKFNLNCSTNVLEEFNKVELNRATKYLNNIDIEDYKTAVVEFGLIKE